MRMPSPMTIASPGFRLRISIGMRLSAQTEDGLHHLIDDGYEAGSLPRMPAGAASPL